MRMLQAHELRAVRAHHLVFLVVAKVPVGVRELGLDLRPVDVELLGDQHRDRGDAALALLGVRDPQGDGAVLVDHDPRIDFGADGGRRRLRPRADARGQCNGHVEAEHQPAAAGVDFAVRLAKDTDFVGKQALLQAKPPASVLRSIVFDDPDAAVLGKEPVFVDGVCAGYVTSAGYSVTVGRTIAYAWLPSHVAVGDVVRVDYRGTGYTATVHAEPVVDPEMTRIRR